MRNPEVRGEIKHVREIVIQDESGCHITVGLWGLASALDVRPNQAIVIYDVVAKMNQFLKEMSININFRDEITVSLYFIEK